MLVLRRDAVEHEHFVVPSFIPVIGILVSLALLTQIEAATYGRAAILVGLGVVLWIVNWLILRRQGDRGYGAAVHLISPDSQVWMMLPVALSIVRSLSENVPLAPLRPMTAVKLSST